MWSFVARVMDRSPDSSGTGVIDSMNSGGATALDRGVLDIMSSPADEKVVVRCGRHAPRAARVVLTV